MKDRKRIEDIFQPKKVIDEMIEFLSKRKVAELRKDESVLNNKLYRKKRRDFLF